MKLRRKSDNTNLEKQSIKKLYDAWENKVITFNSFWKRYERKDRNEQLYRPKYAPKRTRSRDESIPVDRTFEIGEMVFDNKTAAFRHFNRSASTFNALKRKGFSDEQAMGLKPIPDGRKKRSKLFPYEGQLISVYEMHDMSGVAVSTIRDRLNRGANVKQAIGLERIEWTRLVPQSEYWKSKPRREPKPKRISVKGERNGIEVIVNAVTYPSIASAARFYGKDQQTVRGRLYRRKVTIEEALDLTPYTTSRSVSYENEVFNCKKALTDKYEINYGRFCKAMRKTGNDVGKAIQLLLNKSPQKGRLTSKFLENHPTDKSLEREIYVDEVCVSGISPSPAKAFYKVGVTIDYSRRKKELQFVDKSVRHFMNLRSDVAVEIEEKCRDRFEGFLTDKLSATGVDGLKKEVYELTNEELKIVIQFIEKGLHKRGTEVLN